jgi:hypothetical protein
MPLTNCPECFKKLDPEAASCPRCASPIERKPILKKDLGAGAAVYTLMIPAGAVACYCFGGSLIGIAGIILLAIGVVLLSYRVSA